MAADARRVPSRQAAYENLVLNRRIEASNPFVSPSLCASPRSEVALDRPTTVFWSLNSYIAVGCGAVGVNTELPDIFWFR